MIDPVEIIKPLHDSDSYIEVIFMQGSCYKFHLFLKSIYPQAKPLMSNGKDHVITDIGGKFYDITGEVRDIGYLPFDDEDYETVKRWGFSRNKWLSIGECPHCEEPIIA